jgi:hypothetical protein
MLLCTLMCCPCGAHTLYFNVKSFVVCVCCCPLILITPWNRIRILQSIAHPPIRIEEKEPIRKLHFINNRPIETQNDCPIRYDVKKSTNQIRPAECEPPGLPSARCLLFVRYRASVSRFVSVDSVRYLGLLPCATCRTS